MSTNNLIKHIIIGLLISIVCLITSVAGATEELQTIRQIKLDGGSVLRGKISHETENTISVITQEGLEIEVDKQRIVQIEPYIRLFDHTQTNDPKSTRLLFSPTGRPLKKGKGYFTDFYVLLPGFSYGLTDRLSFMIGMSIVPGVGIGNQLKYVAPRYTFHQSDNTASSIGLLNVFVNGGTSGGIAFATHTIGKPDKSFTAGVGWGYLDEKSEDIEFYRYPIVMLGGNIRLSNHMAFVTENWLLIDLPVSTYPFVAGIRFFSKRIAVDVGMMLIGEVLQEGFPVPWLSFAYHVD